MQLLICAGGTGGGVYPALAVLQALNDLNPAWAAERAVLWVGGEDGMERELISRLNIPYEAIPAAGVHGVGLASLPGNLLRLLRGYLRSLRILRDFKPDVMLFTGGYLAVPVAFAGRKVPSLVFMPDIEPGLAIKSIFRQMDTIAISVPDSKNQIPESRSILVSGYPVRNELTAWSREEAFQVLELDPSRPVLLVFGGSRGARSINQALESSLSELPPDLQVVHITGTLDWDEINKRYQTLGDELKARYRVFPFLHEEMGAALKAADLVLSRAGASILGEYPLFGLPAILVPYPHAWRYQKTNAEYLVRNQAAEILLDDELKDSLVSTVKGLLSDPEKLTLMGAAMKKLARPDAGDVIARRLFDLGGQSVEGGVQ